MAMASAAGEMPTVARATVARAARSKVVKLPSMGSVCRSGQPSGIVAPGPPGGGSEGLGTSGVTVAIGVAPLAGSAGLGAGTGAL